MNLIETMFEADRYTQVAYLGLAFCLFWTIAHAFALVRFRLMIGRNSRRLAAVLSGRNCDWSRVPGLLARMGSCLQSTETPDRVLELRMLLKSRIHRACTGIKLCAPAFGVAGTMSGAWAFLAEFDQATAAGGQPSMQGLTDATATTWIGLMIMVTAILLMNRSTSVIETLMQRTIVAMKENPASQSKDTCSSPLGHKLNRKNKSSRHSK